MLSTVVYSLDLFGTAVFAISGALSAGRKQMDIFGAVVLATVTAVGGGTFRDLVLGRTPVFWIDDPLYIWTIVLAGIATFVIARYARFLSRWLVVADAIGLATFTVIGTRIALEYQASAVISVMMGVMTGVLGGMLRDLLSGEIPLVLRREIYATAALAGAVVYALLASSWGHAPVTVIVAAATTLVLRLAALRWHLMLPRFPADKANDEP